MKIIFLMLAIFIPFFMTSEVKAEYIKITSEPLKADIFVRAMDSRNKVKIGVTPYEGNINNLASTYGKNGLFVVSVEKAGHEKNSIIISDAFKGDMDLYMTLDLVQPKTDDAKEESKENIKVLDFDYKKMDKNINQLFEAQRLLRAQQYDDAINLLKRTEVDQNNLSIVPELIGSAYYLKRNMKASLTWFEKAYSMNPENKDAFTMKEYIKKALGTRNEK